MGRELSPCQADRARRGAVRQPAIGRSAPAVALVLLAALLVVVLPASVSARPARESAPDSARGPSRVSDHRHSKSVETYDEALERAGIAPHSSDPSATRPSAVCAAPSRQRFSCMAVAIPERLAAEHKSSPAGPRLEGSGKLGGYSPADLRSAYDLPEQGGSGMTIAITIAYDAPEAESDLAVYRKTYGLPPCTSTDSCFRKVNQEGQPEDYPEPSTDWSAEAAIDLDMASATCPECKLLLVEADNDSNETLPEAVNTAASLGAQVISASWGGEEFAGETALDQDFDHPSIPVLVASGDSGYGSQYPAASPYVSAVGGTTLHKDHSTRGWRETAWSGSGSGCSQYEPKPPWQTDSGCAKRTIADVSAVADPETPVSVYDTYGPYEGWELFGGTSVATPILAGVEAHHDASERSEGAKLFWEEGPEGRLNDITEGRNGACRPEPEYLCTGGFGYNGPTGWGSPGATGRPAPPVVGASYASEVNESDATLNGAINPNGEETSYRFEYGPTTSYGTKVPVPDGSVGSATSAVEVAARLTGLRPDATYHYRLVATNALGTTYSADRAFVTSPWAVQYMPRKKPQREEMLGVSCPSASFCVSVGQQGVYYEPPVPAYNNAPLVERWDGSEWTRESVPLYHQPAEGLASSLEGVSCDSPSSCMAVGENYEIHVGYGPLVERWNGTEWSLLPAPLPAEATKDENGTYEVRVNGVSCVSASFCVLVGQFTKTWEGAGPEEIAPLVETWNGSSWNVQPAPNPTEGKQNPLWGVSCVSSTSCVAVGESRRSTHETTSFIETWNGSTWSIAPAPSVPGGFQGVSCSSSSACMAVGGTEGRFGGKSGVAQAWNGSSWTTLALEHAMRGVSCLAPASCIAVGGDFNSHEAYAAHWNGNDWSAERLSLPVDASDEPMQMFGVSCIPSSCAAVGWYYSWGYAPLAEARVPPSVVSPEPPEYGRCVKVSDGAGKYANAGCTSTGGKDSYEWTPGVLKVHFATKLASGPVTFETIKGSKLTCTGETSTGEHSGTKTLGAVVLTLTGCTRNAEKCSTGSVAGEIVSNPLEGVLGVEQPGATSSKNKIALDLHPAGKTEPLMTFSCGETSVSVRGSVIVPVTANKMSVTQALKFKASRGKQKPESLAGEPRDVLEISLNGEPYEQTGLTLKTTETNEEQIEINSAY